MKSRRTSAGLIAPFLVLAFVCLLVFAFTASAAEFRSARVTRIIKDVRLLPTQKTPRAAAVNDEVSAGTAVRTGEDSRTELTFADLTLTRLGANTIFTFNEGTRQVDLGAGAVLVQVPRNGADMKIVTAAVTAAVSGGTALFEANKGFPIKFLMLEGIGHFYPTGHPELAVIVHGGEMVMKMANGETSQPAKFDAAKVYNTSLLITDFPTLANADLIFEVIDEQQAETSEARPAPTPPQDSIDKTDQAIAAIPPSPVSVKFGKPAVITTPDPYIISSGTQIGTDPTITTNGVTDLGKIYRGPAADGSEFDYLFDSTSAFDTAIGTFFNANGNGVPVAVFKFSHLQLSGDPIVTIPGGATTFLGFVSVGDITLGVPVGTVTFNGAQRVFFATQAGAINFDSSIAFSGISHLTFYARGAGSNLTLASPISGSDVVHLVAEGTTQINGDITASTEFRSFSGGDFLVGTGTITALNLDIESLSNMTIDSNQFPDVAGGSLILDAAGTLNIAVTGGTYGRDSLTAQGMAINLTSAAVVTLDFLNATASFTAGTGGINAPNIDFTGSGAGLDFISAGGITAHSITTSGLANGTIAANGGALNLTGDLVSGAVNALTDIDVGGNITAQSLDAGGTITAGGEMRAFGAINAGGDITADTVAISAGGITTAGNLIAGSGGIHPFVVSPGGAAVQATATVAAITSPNGIDFSGNQFLGIDGLSSGGRLTINANSLTFDPASGVASANFNGADANAFGPGSPPDGGNGGLFVVNATGDITANAGADIMATTGLNSASGVFSGAGGSVTLQSTAGTVTVNDTVQVSSDDGPGQRQSARGGNITITSGKTNGVAINISNSGQLLALLNTVAPGPGGTITIMATAPTSNSAVNINGTVQADRGTVDIEHAGDSGQINLTNATLRADIVKVGAFGTNGTLNIGGGALSADTTLKLYAPGSNGQIVFVANCAIGGGSATILAANAVTINTGVMVNVTGQRADVFVNSTLGIPNANYAATSGGNNMTNGTFTGAGANNPQPLTGAPGF